MTNPNMWPSLCVTLSKQIGVWQFPKVEKGEEEEAPKQNPVRENTEAEWGGWRPHYEESEWVYL